VLETCSLKYIAFIVASTYRLVWMPLIYENPTPGSKPASVLGLHAHMVTLPFYVACGVFNIETGCPILRWLLIVSCWHSFCFLCICQWSGSKPGLFKCFIFWPLDHWGSLYWFLVTEFFLRICLSLSWSRNSLPIMKPKSSLPFSQ